MAHDAWLVDLDGTLYFPMPVKAARAAELLATGRSAIGALRQFRHHHEKLREHPVEAPDQYRIQLERTAESLGLATESLSELVTEWMHDRPGRWIRLFRRRSLLDEIAEHRAAGGKTALVSDYPARRKLAALGAESLFDVVIASGEPEGPRWLKPHPEGYLLAARALGVEPPRCLVIGDRDDADGSAARSAGMAFRLVG